MRGDVADAGDVADVARAGEYCATHSMSDTIVTR